ncbi:alpha-ketoglutarate-dependent dioxygenase alkB homolog 6 [Cephus cinctus]|uniref:Alpha-ketoglutarate-dependent dioxygenase alkB homolog 6 n=1 Tax=Cephus cinctus TaxID=211228 RepID=A0AAJ7FMT1_CEPCN|nr:alpha-ketoglutarate-dependent dioxygenase alkB homolog 6 [Cephus cinctus]
MGDENEQRSNYSKNAIRQVPPSAYYIPNFISEDEEKEIIKKVNAAPLPKWTQLSHRRLQNWGGIPHPKGMIAEKIPDWLQKYVDKISNLGVFDVNTLPNHVLINEYLPNQGIMAHSDGPLFHPTVTTISCGSHTVLEFYKRINTDNVEKEAELEFSFFLEPRSLLILQNELYSNYLHSIAERKSDIITKCSIKNIDLCSNDYKEGQAIERETRLSLTIRHVPKTSKLKLKFGR